MNGSQDDYLVPTYLSVTKVFSSVFLFAVVRIFIYLTLYA